MVLAKISTNPVTPHTAFSAAAARRVPSNGLQPVDAHGGDEEWPWRSHGFGVVF